MILKDVKRQERADRQLENPIIISGIKGDGFHTTHSTFLYLKDVGFIGITILSIHKKFDNLYKQL